MYRNPIILITFLAVFGTTSGLGQQPLMTIPEVEVQYDFFTQSKLGTAFKILEDGYLTKVRLLSNSEDTGEKLISLWEINGVQSVLVSGPHVWKNPVSVSGWLEFEFQYSIPLKNNKTYILSVYDANDSRSGENLTVKNDPNTFRGKTHSLDGITKGTKWYFITSPRVSVVINLQLKPGVIGTEQTLCYNSVPKPLQQITPPTGGTVNYAYQWQSSADTLLWTDINGADLASYAPSALKSSIWYRLKITSGNNVTAYSNKVLITVYRPISQCTIGSSQTICYNKLPEILRMQVPPSGGSGSYNFQWQSSSDNSVWIDIPSATKSEFQPPPLTADLRYRCMVSYGACGILFSNTVLITVIQDLNPGRIGQDQNICYNNAPSALIQTEPASGGNGTFAYQWQISSDNNAWRNISGANSSTYSPSALIVNSWFRRNVSSGDCEAKSSNSILISVYPDLIAGSIGSSQTICYNTVPAGLVQTSGASGGTGIIMYQWQRSSDNNSWSAIPGANGIIYSPPALTSTTWFRRVASSGDCAPAISNSIQVTVYSNLNSGIIGSNQSICFNRIPSPFTQLSPATGGNGLYSYQWQISPDNVDWTNIAGATSVTYAAPTPASSSWYRRIVSSGICGTAISNAVLINVIPILNPGSILGNQEICSNTSPATLTGTVPSGGTGAYIYQWQLSTDNTSWENINNTNSINYSPAPISTTTWYRRNTTSGCTESSNSVRIDLYPVMSSAQLSGSKTIIENTSTSFTLTISGGVPPFTINYSRNGTPQQVITGYSNSLEISTGILTTGSYTYRLISVTDQNGCNAQNLGSSITITAVPVQSASTNKALVIVNSLSSSFSDFRDYINPYLDNFGIPYDVCDVGTSSLPVLNDYSVLIFGHRNVYSSGYPIGALETAIAGGVGLYSFDPHLFDYSSGFSTIVSQRSVISSQINIVNTSNYITEYHIPDSYQPSNNIVYLRNAFSATQSSSLTGGTTLASMTSGGQTVSLMEVSNYGNGKIVKWTGYDWVFDNILGPVYGMDDLIWKGIIWASRKPFIMQGLPPMLTMRVDDVDGTGTDIENDFTWVKICNEFNIIPWLGLFTLNIPSGYIGTLRDLINSGKTTASPHAKGYATTYSGFIYYNHDNLPSFDPAAETRAARNFFTQNGLSMSNYVVPHYYEYASAALSEIRAMGGEFLAIHWLPDNSYDPPPVWINCAPYRLNRYGTSSTSEARPVYYAGYVNLAGIEFFNCLSEIRDDGGYEWFPDNSVSSTAARGIRHLRRSFNSMVLASLFTHEQHISNISTSNWREILRIITTSVSGYNPQYVSTDYAVRYIRAKTNLKITNVQNNTTTINISYSGNNDMDTRCYLFTEQNGQIAYSFVTLPQINGFNTITVSK